MSGMPSYDDVYWWDALLEEESFTMTTYVIDVGKAADVRLVMRLVQRNEPFTLIVL